ncbi:hypothetical protein DZF79_30750 [Vibrio parahaemolyticus]|uniref:hypothetical protein n=1 Tax=Vibrio parahaemolyticus TaxID=670 RepID=UPI001E03B2BC|nr:hypothetical protein [Vibrio parahaemolyticus]EGR2232554.1 hypothetical protein [Vibrio parahaemolyticus]HCD1298705.1 hypothetical protein [Vibrio parahaemolyticus]HCE2002332.1 hypothetical protein [Vibrio parahaemolyticus]HCG6739016.1 hypothetical protein [Vibrio parahaemolyticus]
MESIEELLNEARFKFSQVSDFIWKSPNFIEHEKELEKRKVKAYFPDDERLAAIRWYLESTKLEDIYPKAISMGNLFYAASLFETYVLRLAYIIERSSELKLSDQRGMGITKLLKYLKSNDIDYSNIELWESVDALLKLRNCLAHANGHIDFLKNKKEVLNIVNNRLYLTPEQRKIRLERIKDGKGYNDIVEISTSELGHFLCIKNTCAHVGLHIFENFFRSLCLSACDMEL